MGADKRKWKQIGVDETGVDGDLGSGHGWLRVANREDEKNRKK